MFRDIFMGEDHRRHLLYIHMCYHNITTHCDVYSNTLRVSHKKKALNKEDKENANNS